MTLSTTGAMAGAKTTEKSVSFSECRALLQAYAGALSGKIAKYSTNTPKKLESSFRSSDGTMKYKITCLAEQKKMIIVEKSL